MSTDSAAAMQYLRIRGARTHNLKNIDLDIPRDRLVVVTGPSGSGKSSLAFDTLYAEGQRRYVQSLSAYARQFLGQLDKPDVDSIEGLSPAISIGQKSAGHNPRSTVGTVTEIHDYLRLLYARAGTPHCPEHGVALRVHTVSQMVDAVLALPEGTRVALLAPVARQRPGAECAALLAQMQAQGYVRFRLDGNMGEAADGFVARGARTLHDMDVVIDRIKVRAGLQDRLADSFEAALRCAAQNAAQAAPKAIALELDSAAEHVFSARLACPVCDWTLPALEPTLFSFNAPAGACPTCGGLGSLEAFDPARVVAHPHLSLAAGAIPGWERRNRLYFCLLENVLRHYGEDIEKPFAQLPQALRDVVLHGSGAQEIAFDYALQGQTLVKHHPFEGVLANLERRWRESASSSAASVMRERLARLRSVHVCPDCGGARLGQAARHVRVGAGAQARGIDAVNRATLREALAWCQSLVLRGAQAQIAAPLLREIGARLAFLVDVGLDYLCLGRAANTLSGGEAQRIRLASQIGAGLSGVLYVLDEPSIGLHQRDNDRLIATLRRLRDLGNSVIVVEHDADTMRAADHIIDLGPGAGVHGGRVMAQGTCAQLCANPASPTGRWLAGKERIAVPGQRTPWRSPQHAIAITGASGNNLKNVDAAFPAGLLTCVTGVSGSGKSTLVNDTLHAACARHLHRAQVQAAPYQTITGLEYLDKVVHVDQAPLGRTPRSNPATYTGLFTPLRELLAATPAARERGWGAGRFSFNVAGGRCPVCQGDGLVRVEMHFLPDVYVPCDACRGLRYNRETLAVQWKGRNVAQMLDMTVEEAAAFFKDQPPIARKLQTLLDVGLGYMRLGQSATTLSGGEAQRVKLALELARSSSGRTLYILDEPTTGLHFADIALLLKALSRLRDAGNSVVVIEHNLEVIKTADWMIDMGPEGGAGGGQVLAAGTPEAIAACPASHTGHHLRRVL